MKSHLPVARRMRGFTLIEVFIAIAILGALTVAVVTAMNTFNRAQERDDMYAVEVRELAVLDRAVREKIREIAYTNPLPAGTNSGLTIPTLIAENKLPTDFANRYGGVGNSPLGQGYRIVVRKVAAIAGPPAIREHMTAVIYEDLASSPLIARLERVGLANRPDQIRQTKAAIAVRAAAQRLIAGVVEQGGRTVRGPSGGFTKDLSAYFPANAVTSQAALLIGFMDLEPADPNGTGPTPGLNISRCSVVKSYCQSADCQTGSVVPAMCTGGRIQAGSWPHCGDPDGNVAFGVPLLNEAMLLSTVQRTVYPNPIDCADYARRQTGRTYGEACGFSSEFLATQPCVDHLSARDFCSARFRTVETYQHHSLGGGQITEDNLCMTETWRYLAPGDSSPNQTFQFWPYPTLQPAGGFQDLMCCQP